MKLLDADMELGNLILASSAEMEEVAREALILAQERVLANIRGSSNSSSASFMVVKRLCSIRLMMLPPTPDTYRANISSVRCADADQLLCISGTVIRTGRGRDQARAEKRVRSAGTAAAS